MYRSRILCLVCLSIAVLVFDAAAQTTGKDPVIIIPGVTGSQLYNPHDDKTVWFSVKRDKDDDLRLPMTSPILANNRDGLKVKDIIRTIQLKVLPDVEVYQTLIDALIAKGYTEGDWNKPKATDVYYVFPYDWRRDNVESARLLMQKMAAVKRAVRRPRLKFDILAHSMGGLIARYAAMYGVADLPRDGVTPVPTWAGATSINKLMLFGTPNEGSFNSLDALLNGYPIILDRKLPFIDDLRPEDVLTCPSAFQLIPHQASARFLDENLKPINVDIYSVDTWLKYGWGAIADPKFLSKLKDADRLALKNKEIKPAELPKNPSRDDLLIAQTTYAQVLAYMTSALNRAKRFHASLDAAIKTTPIQIYAYGGNCEPTLDAVVLIRDEPKNRWLTFVDAHDIKTSTGTQIKKDDVKSAMFAVGDGRVTKRSLLTESKSSTASALEIKTMIPFTATFFACSSHTKLFLEKPIQDSFLSALVVTQQKQP